MKRLLTIAQATALEILAEPLSLLICLSSLALAVLSPTLHYHQFGDVERMARDAGLSAVFLGGTLQFVFGSTRSLRRELETGTADLALSHAVSFRGFLLAKFAGALFAYAVFVATVLAISSVMIVGMQAGGRIAARTGDVARVYRPLLALALAVIILAPTVAAVLNRFLHFRFAYTANWLLLALSLIGAAAVSCSDSVAFVPVGILAALPAVFVTAVAFAAAVRFKLNGALAIGAVAFAVQVPCFGSYYLPEVLAKGGTLPMWYFMAAIAALVPAVAAVLVDLPGRK